MQDLAERARTKKLNPDEVQGGTFTITNPGCSADCSACRSSTSRRWRSSASAGSRSGWSSDDAIAIRSMAYLALSYDHRVVDGAVADQFLAMVKTQIETFDPAAL